MRRNIVHEGAGSLSYAIREIVAVGNRFAALGSNIVWENIGDPVQKGETIAPWIKEIVAGLVQKDATWAYCPTAGMRDTREFLASAVNARGGARITPDDIIFFNGIGDAVAKVYGFLRREARVLGPTPAYSTHSSAEAAHSGYEHLTYELDPHNNWMPNIDDIRMKVKYNDSIAAILLINPDNPTGAVYSREVLEEIVEIAREHDLFLICDEIYAHITYNGHRSLHLSEVVGDDVCAIVMRGISKEYPWPGARCGWIEVLNRKRDPMFDRYVQSLLASKMLEVCSTTVPQVSIPLVMGDPRYRGHLDMRAAVYEKRAREAVAHFQGIPGIVANIPNGAFYLTVMFEDGVLTPNQSLPIDNAEIRRIVGELTPGKPLDYRFVYHLLGARGICTVPLTSFCCRHHGFRVTLLETDDARRNWTFATIAQAIRDYTGA